MRKSILYGVSYIRPNTSQTDNLTAPLRSFLLTNLRPNAPDFVLCCGCLEAKRSFDFLFVNYCIKMKRYGLSVFGFVTISVLRSRSSHPLKPIRSGAPCFGLGYAVGPSWPFNWICGNDKWRHVYGSQAAQKLC